MVEQRQFHTPCEPREQLRRVAHLEDDDVRLHRRRVEAYAGQLGQPLRECARVGMILGQAPDVVIERVDAGSGEHPRLAQRAAQHLLETPRLRDQLGGAREHRADRRAEALGEVDPRRVERRRVIARRDAGGDDGVHQPRAVEMRAQSVHARELEYLMDGLQRPHPASAEVGRLLDAHQPRARRVSLIDPQRRLHLSGREDSALAVERAEHRSRQLRRPAGLGHDRMRAALEDHLVAAWANVQAQRNLVAHRAARQEHRGLVAEQLRHASLQALRCGVGAALLIADLGGCDGRAHPLAGPRLRVAVEIDGIQAAAQVSATKPAPTGCSEPCQAHPIDSPTSCRLRCVTSGVLGVGSARARR